MELNIFCIAETIVFTVLQYIAVEDSTVIRGGEKRDGWRKNKFITVFPAKFSGDSRLEGDIFSRIPMVDQRVGDEAFIETENQVGKRCNFIFCIGKIKIDEVAIAGK